MILRAKEELSNWRRDFKGKLIVSNGCFDLITRGHCSFLKQAKALGDFLLVGINSDTSVRLLKGESRPINNQEARAEVLDSLKFVDGVYIFDSVRCNEFIELSRPNIYVKASDYSLETLNPQEKLALEKSGAIILFLNYIEGYSTTKTIEKIKSNGNTGVYSDCGFTSPGFQSWMKKLPDKLHIGKKVKVVKGRHAGREGIITDHWQNLDDCSGGYGSHLYQLDGDLEKYGYKNNSCAINAEDCELET